MTTSTTPSAPALTGLADFFTRWHCIHSNTSTTSSVAVSPVFAARLGEFFFAWAERPDALSAKPAMPEPLANQLQRFAGEWRRLVRPLEPPRSSRVIDWAAKALELTRFFQDLRPALQAQRRLGSSINVWRAGGLGSDELRNSKVLAWLLDCRETHGQGEKMLAALLDSVDRRVKDFPTSVATSLPYWTRTESCPLNQKESRVDIEIDGEGLLLFIEVKINAMETSDQLDRYLEIAEAKARGRPWGLIYLTRDGQAPVRFRETTGNGRLIPVSWKEVATLIKRHYETLPDCIARVVLRQLVEHIRSFC